MTATNRKAGDLMGNQRTFYLLACLECGDPEKPLMMPFESPRERGQWAAGHTAGTGHDQWLVTTDVREVSRG